MSSDENGGNRIEREIRSWVYIEIKHSRRVGLSKAQFKKAIRVAMKQLTKIAVEEADKY